MTLLGPGAGVAGLDGAGVNPGEGEGWYRLPPVNGSENPL